MAAPAPALDLGSDPSFAELLARVRTLLRRGPMREAESYTIADLEIDGPSGRDLVARGRLAYHQVPGQGIQCILGRGTARLVAVQPLDAL